MGRSIFFQKMEGFGVLNMRFGGLQIFCKKLGALDFVGIMRKTIVIIMILTKEVEEK